MPTMGIMEFKQKCLQLVDELGREGIILTKRGKAVARVTQFQPGNVAHLIGALKDRVHVFGDLTEPTGDWDGEPELGYSHPGVSVAGPVDSSRGAADPGGI